MGTKTRILGGLGALLVAGGALVAWHRGAGERGPGAIRNVLLISIDTCRADHLGCHGDRRGITPRIDALAGEAVRFADALSPVPLTLPAHASLLTGTNPPYHGSHDNLNYRVDESIVTLAELLRERGFETAAVVSAFVLDSQFGLDQGFDRYDDDFAAPRQGVPIAERKAEETGSAAIRWLRAHRDRPFFLFVHFYDPHDPYEPPEPFASRFAGSPYAGEIAYVDAWVGGILDELQVSGLADSTLLVLASDHGEMLGEHGERTHGYFVYQTALRVPLLVRMPGQSAGRVVEGPCGLVDVVPTVCGLLGIDPPAASVGEDLSAVVRGSRRRPADGPRYCESWTPTTYGANALLGVVADGWQFIQASRPELYDVRADPGQTTDVAAQHPERARDMQERLKQVLQCERRDDADSRIELDPQARARIESLGYVGGAAARDAAGYEQRPERDDPKDLIDFHNAYASVSGHLARREYDQAREICRRLVERRSDFLAGHLTLARIAVEQADHARAEAHLEAALRLEPQNAEALGALGFVLASRRQHEQAIDHYRRSLALRPADARTRTMLGAALASTGRHDEAIAEHRRALELDPDLADAHANLGLALLEQRQVDAAIEHFRQALRLDSRHADAHHNLAVALEAQDQPDKALEHYEQALSARPDHVEARVNLGILLARRGHAAQAMDHFRLALHARPEYALAHYNLGLLLGTGGPQAESLDHLREAVRLDPAYAKGRFHLGVGLASAGLVAEALEQFREAARLVPDWPAPLNEQAWLLATRPAEEGGDGQAALALAERAIELGGADDPALLDTLAAACAAAGQYTRAQATAQDALDRAGAAGRSALAEQIRQRLAIYRQNKPYRETR